MSRRHHRYGRDSLTGGKQHSVLAAIGGFLIGPAVVGLGAGLAAKTMNQTTPKAAATTYAAAHLAGLGASWWGAKKYPQARSFLRGAMWGEGVTAALASASAASLVNIPTPPPGAPAPISASLAPTSGSSAQAQLTALSSRLITGDWFRKA